MKFGLLKYRTEERNIGDYIQSIAARRFLPEINAYLSREDLNSYSGDEMKMILNGWFMHKPSNWPPSKDINPLFISFHINESVSEALTSDEAIKYYKDHEPIGCRDKYTRDLLISKGVEAYFSGCITLTLEKERFKSPVKGCDVVVCDPFWATYSFSELFANTNLSALQKIIRVPYCFFMQKRFRFLIRKLIPKNVSTPKFLTHFLNKNQKTSDKFIIAEQMLREYANAKLVITGRIHVALPCLAFNTPVLFVNPEKDTSRFDGVTDLFNEVSIQDLKELSRSELQKKYCFKKIQNSDAYVKYRNKLINDCEKFIG